MTGYPQKLDTKRTVQMKKLFSSQGGIAHIFLLLILLVGLGVGFYLVNYTKTNLKPKASEGDYQITFRNAGTLRVVGDKITSIPDSSFFVFTGEVTVLPYGWIYADEVANSSIIPAAQAQYDTDLTLCPVDDSCCLKPIIDARCKDNDECVAKNKDFGWCYSGFCIYNNYREGQKCEISIASTPIKTDAKTSQKEVFPHIIKKIRYYAIDTASGQRYLIGRFDPKTLQSTRKKAVEITLEPYYRAVGYDENKKDNIQFDVPIEVDLIARDGCINDSLGAQNEDGCIIRTIQTQIKIIPSVVNKSLNDRTNMPTRKPESIDAPDLPDVDESRLMVVPIEVFIHTSLDYGMATGIANNAINYRMNPLLKKAGKKLKITSTSSISHNRCPDVSCRLAPGTIGLYMYGNGNYFVRIKNETGIAYPAMMQAGVAVFASDRALSENIVIHELLHIFNLPDYYEEAISRNEVSLEYIFKSYNQDVMSDAGSTNKQIISNASLNMVKGITRLPAASTNDPRSMGDVMAWSYTPGNLIIKTIAGALVEVFPQVVRNNNYAISLDEKSFFGVTDSDGKISLGNYTHYMKPEPSKGGGRSAFIKVSKDGKIAYRAITRSELNKLFFEGKVSDAEIEMILY